jgi:DNA-binding phage protein
MPLTRSFRETVAKRARNDAAFRAALVEEAAQNILDGDVETALGQLRDVVNATMGFDALAAATGLPKTSLMRMLGPHGNPRADNLGNILKALGRHTGVHIVVRAEPVPEPEAA